MNNGDQHIEDLFKNAFENSQATPPNEVWSRIDKELNDASVNKLYHAKFEEEEEEVPVSIWFKIQQRLWVKEFMQFNPVKINVYYTSLVAVLSGLGVLLFQKEPSSVIKQKVIINHSSEIKSSAQKVVNPNTFSTQESIVPKNQKTIVKSFSANRATTNHNVAILPNQEKSAQLPTSQTTNELNVSFSITGDTVICNNSDHQYTLSGSLPDGASVIWSCSPGGVTVQQISNQKVIINCKTQGEAVLTATITKGTSSNIVQLPIKINEPIIPKISGNIKICEGSTQQYKVTGVQNINQLCTWIVDKNKYTVLSNGCISVDGNLVGYDTIRFSDTHLGSGCKLTAFLPITVFSKPIPDFNFTDNGNGLITFENTSICNPVASKCKLTCKWSINEQSFSGNTVNVTFKDDGVYTAILEVQTENNCKSFTKKDVTIAEHNLIVANAFSPQNESNGFIPKGENLATYKFEIYTINNIKLWESTALEDGKPSEGWNGIVNGQLQPKGRYIWKVSATFQDGTVWKGVKINGHYQTSATFQIL